MKKSPQQTEPVILDLQVLLGKAIEVARKRKGMTVAQLAKAMEVSPSHMEDWEAGRARIVVETLFRVSRILNVPAARFMRAAELLWDETKSPQRKGTLFKVRQQRLQAERKKQSEEVQKRGLAALGETMARDAIRHDFTEGQQGREQ